MPHFRLRALPSLVAGSAIVPASGAPRPVSSPAVLDQFAQEAVHRRQERGEAVTLPAVQAQLLEEFGAERPADLGLRRAEDLPTLGKVSETDHAL